MLFFLPFSLNNITSISADFCKSSKTVYFYSSHKRNMYMTPHSIVSTTYNYNPMRATVKQKVIQYL